MYKKYFKKIIISVSFLFFLIFIIIILIKADHFNNKYNYRIFKKYFSDDYIKNSIFKYNEIFRLINKNIKYNKDKYYIIIGNKKWNLYYFNNLKDTNFNEYFTKDNIKHLIKKYENNFFILIYLDRFIFILKHGLLFRKYYVLVVYNIIKFKDSGKIYKNLKVFSFASSPYIPLLKPSDEYFIIKNSTSHKLLNFNKVYLFKKYLMKNHFNFRSIENLLSRYSENNLNLILKEIYSQLYVKKIIFLGIIKYEKEYSLFNSNNYN